MIDAVKSFWGDFCTYVGRIKLFSTEDWIVYVVWNGLMVGLFAMVASFLFIGSQHGIVYPTMVWNIPLGIACFVLAIAIDTIGHRTIYKEALAQGEALIHHMTIFSGIASVVLLCLGYAHPAAMRVPALVFIFLSVVYSFFDEALHWHRYLTKKSDRIEMWSHFFILVGHLTMIISWWIWFNDGYPGVEGTLLWLK
jgi:hypothetical protein